MKKKIRFHKKARDPAIMMRNKRKDATGYVITHRPKDYYRWSAKQKRDWEKIT